MQRYMNNWINDAIAQVITAYGTANAALPPGQTLRQWPAVQAVLTSWVNRGTNNNGQILQFSIQLYSAMIPLPQLPPGTGGGGA